MSRIPLQLPRATILRMSENVKSLDAKSREIRLGDQVAAPRLNGVRIERVKKISEDGRELSFESGGSELAARVAVCP